MDFGLTMTAEDIAAFVGGISSSFVVVFLVGVPVMLALAVMVFKMIRELVTGWRTPVGRRSVSGRGDWRPDLWEIGEEGTKEEVQEYRSEEEEGPRESPEMFEVVRDREKLRKEMGLPEGW